MFGRLVYRLFVKKCINAGQSIAGHFFSNSVFIDLARYET
jgi:hypothetical protein